ncbi:MAG: response regulator [Candidatus Berkiella sp.]
MKNKTILVVEDNEMNMDIASQLLEMEGYSVLRALDGQTGIRLASTHKPDLILMDMQMPDQDGFEITRALKQDPNTASIKVVAFTALVMEEDRKNAIDCGCIGMITKPIEVADFAAKIESFFKTLQ